MSDLTPHAHADGPHVVPLRFLAAVFAALMLLTVLTVAATWVDLGQLNLIIALTIAVIKAGLVALFFMHLRWDSPFYALIVILALAFVGLFVAIPMLDAGGYQQGIKAAYEAAGTVSGK